MTSRFLDYSLPTFERDLSPYAPAVGDQFWSQNSFNVEGSAENYDSFGARLAAGNFKGNGRYGLAIGVPGESIGTIATAGAVNVLYGSRNGLTATGDQIWDQNSLNVEGVSETPDAFGNSLSAGDFNGDGRDDLAIGVPGESIGAIATAGAVNVLYGSRKGLTVTGDQIWHQDSPNVEGGSETPDAFGDSLTAGDFNGDGRDDLAIGVPGESIGSVAAAGAVNVLYGSGSGLTATSDQIWHQDSPNVEGGSESNDTFGEALTTGDFNGDGRDDLAIGVPLEDVGTITNAGAVNVLYGSGSGLTATSDQIWDQNSPNVEGGSEAYDDFGRSLAAGDFNGDGRDDLAIGVPLEDVGTITNAGAVNVLYGSGSGLTATSDQIWDQNSPNVEGVAETSDYFGATLGVGDFNGDGRDDLAIGSVLEDVGSVESAGAVNVLYGSGKGLTAIGDQVWHQNSPGILDIAEAYDYFGSSLSVGDFNNDGFDDLAIGVRGESLGSIIGAGAVQILYGSSSGLTA